MLRILGAIAPRLGGAVGTLFVNFTPIDPRWAREVMSRGVQNRARRIRRAGFAREWQITGFRRDAGKRKRRNCFPQPPRREARGRSDHSERRARPNRGAGEIYRLHRGHPKVLSMPAAVTGAIIQSAVGTPPERKSLFERSLSIAAALAM